MCEWAGDAVLEPVAPLVRYPRPAPLLTVGFALTKADHPEWAVQRLTEAGADRVVVVMSARCVARWPAAKQERQLGRLREVARQAAMQSRRAWLPEVEGPVPFSDLVPAGLGAGAAPGTLSASGTLSAPGARALWPHRALWPRLWPWPCPEEVLSACPHPPCWWARRAGGPTTS